jgi:molybdopterin-guanine dinucleotide biosynthesis protein
MIEVPNHLTVLVVAGVSSNSGKTTLVCELLRRLSLTASWEAIKLTRGHYRSCGKDPHACCVSDLLGAEATVRSGRAATYAAGKDTGRYWDAGANNVHWVIATNEQVESGIATALAQVKTSGVIIEGTSVLRYLTPAFTLLTVGEQPNKLKASARVALQANQIQAVYADNVQPCEWPAPLADLPRYDQSQLDKFCAQLSSRERPLL